jgi:hypothetical protein
MLVEEADPFDQMPFLFRNHAVRICAWLAVG